MLSSSRWGVSIPQKIEPPLYSTPVCPCLKFVDTYLPLAISMEEGGFEQKKSAHHKKHSPSNESPKRERMQFNIAYCHRKTGSIVLRLEKMGGGGEWLRMSISFVGLSKFCQCSLLRHPTSRRGGGGVYPWAVFGGLELQNAIDLMRLH